MMSLHMCGQVAALNGAELSQRSSQSACYKGMCIRQHADTHANQCGVSKTSLAASALLSGCGSGLVIGNGMEGAGGDGDGWAGGLRISAGSLAAS